MILSGEKQTHRSLYSFICCLGDEQRGKESLLRQQNTENKRNLVWAEVAGISMRDEFIVT